MFSNNSESGESLFSRRVFIVAILKYMAFIIIAARLFFLQILKSDEYKTLSDHNRVKFLLLEPKRGSILDRKGIVLAENIVNYRLYFYKQRKQNFISILENVFLVLKLSKNQRKLLVKKVTDANYINPILIEENLSWAQVARIESNIYKLSGVYIDKGHTRFYPLKNACLHTVGYVGSPSAENIKKYKLFYNREFKIGKAGIERIYDEDFIGQFGNKKVEINAHMVVVRELSYKRSVTGKDIRLSLDSRLQQSIYNKMNKEGATVILANAKTGNILSMLSTPAFDPNIFNESISKDKWNEIITHKSHPLINKSLSKLYPPGSIWKIVVALAFLDQGIDPKKKIHCTGFIEVGNRRYKCWKRHGHGYVDFNQALAQSCNSYFYELAPTVGIDNIHKIAVILGFGKKVGVELPGELSGINPNKSWKKEMYGRDWIVGDTVNACIGQGYNSVTMMQVVTMMARITSGKNITPSLLLQEEDEVGKLTISEKHLNMVKDVLSNVFNKPYGLGYRNRIEEKEFMIGGKTGTSQIISQDATLMANKNLRSHALFAGFAPVHDPEYVIAVAVDNAGWGSKSAAPLAKEILHFVQKNYIKA